MTWDGAALVRVIDRQELADLVLRGGRVVNVCTEEIQRVDVVIAQGRVACLADGYEGREEIFLDGALVLPGLIDGHVHIESSLLTPLEFARVVIPRGTTAVVADAHEMGNVLGIEGLLSMLENGARSPLSLFLTLPSSVPAGPREASAHRLEAEDLLRLRQHPQVVGLGEVMAPPQILAHDPSWQAKLSAFANSPIDGHAPAYRGQFLAAYRALGPSTDHETTRLEEAREKLALGFCLLLREGSAARNLAALAPAVTAATAPHCMLATDDRDAHDLVTEGHIDHALRVAIRSGIPLPRAVAMATLNPATHYRLSGIGALVPGYRADIAVFADEHLDRPLLTLAGGRVVARERRSCFDPPPLPAGREPQRNTVRLAPTQPEDLGLGRSTGRWRLPVLEVFPDQIETRLGEAEVELRDGWVVSPDDCALAVLLDRHRGSGKMGRAVVRGFGRLTGAIAGSVAHDGHPLVAVAGDGQSLHTALRALQEAGGGLVVTRGEEVLAALPLPVAGLLSPLPAAEVARLDGEVRSAARRIGTDLPNPLMTLSFIALTVIPEVRLTLEGLWDVRRQTLLPLPADPAFADRQA